MPTWKLPKDLVIRSGGQTGVDRAALDWAILHGIRHRGWCPKGRLAEDGVIDPQYQLQETESPTYSERTKKNVKDSDGTVLFSIAKGLTGGTLLTLRFARELGKPWIHLHRNIGLPQRELLEFLGKYQVKDLNIAGPRNSSEPAAYNFVREVLDRAFSELPS